MSRFPYHASHRSAFGQARAARQKGVALLVALVMLIIIGLTSASVMRGALSSDLIAQNTRVQSLAMQAAQMGLTYCEYKLEESTPATGGSDMAKLKTVADGADFWNNLANWTAANYHVVPDDWVSSDDSSFTPATAPQCMVQQLANTAHGDQVFEVTARGFSPDYSADGDGATTSGSVVWLQSRVLYEAP